MNRIKHLIKLILFGVIAAVLFVLGSCNCMSFSTASISCNRFV